MRHIALAVLVLALPAQPALARSHSHGAHAAAHPHHHAHHARAVHRHRHHWARRHHRHAIRTVRAEPAGAQFGAPFPFTFGTVWQPQQPATAWQQQPSMRAAHTRARRSQSAGQNSAYAGLVAQHAAANGLPVSLVHRVIMRESRYNARAAHAGNYGIMQIRLGTARAMGYSGSAAGLLDANTNMTYAVRYLAGAYRAAGGNESRAVALYARGYRVARAR
jgi:soluble lytic murein transglycosylase-like protein